MKHAQYQCIWAVHDLEKTNATFQIITGNMYFKISFIYPAKWIRSLFSSNLCPCGCPLTRLVAVVPLKNVNSAGSSISGTFVFYWFHLELVPWPPTRRREDWCHSFEISVSKQQQQQLNHESKSRVCLLSPRWLISRSKIQPWFLPKSKGGTREREGKREEDFAEVYSGFVLPAINASTMSTYLMTQVAAKSFCLDASLFSGNKEQFMETSLTNTWAMCCSKSKLWTALMYEWH